MGKHLHCFVLVLIGLLVLSCNPNDDNSLSNKSNNDFGENFGSAVSRDFIGQVVNENNQPLQGVLVKIGTSTVQTDVNGVFIINNANVYQRFAYITAKKSGYFDGSRAMVPTSGKNNVKIMLISNTPVQTIQSGVASEVTLPNGTKVNFDGAFQDENGASYSGSVQVAMYHLEASNENLSSLMPGMLYAEDANGEEKVLETYGMMNVEMKGSGGQKLQIASGHTAQITMAIDDTQLATAPNTIPLWHFDEVNGYWKEEGSAQRVGNNYVGTVSHFSWWNCDAQFPTVSLTVNVTDTEGNPLSGVNVKITRAAFGYGTYGITDNNGQVSGLVPSNEPLIIDIYSSFNQCNIYSASVGPFNVNTVLPTIVINSSATAFTTQVIGDLKKCDGSNVTHGYIIMKSTVYSSALAFVSNGAFSFNTIYCDGNTAFSLEGFDYDTMQTTGLINYNYTPMTTQIGNLTACTSISEFISYQIDNNPVRYIINGINAGLGPNGEPNQLFVYGTSSNLQSIYILGTTNTPGIYTASQFTLGIHTLGNPSSDTLNAGSFNLNSFGAIGQYIDMTFSGNYSDAVGNHTINGTVHVIRDN